MMKNFNKGLIGGLLMVSLVSCEAPPAKTQDVDYINQNWAMADLWNDGMAEVAIYDAERVIYGKPRNFEYVYVLVKETFNEQYHVKTDNYDRDDLYEVMKVNKFCRIPTLKYPYHYLTSLFYQRENPGTVHKLTNTSQEWCGNTAKSFLEKDNSYLFEYLSYWDGEGNGEANINKGPLFEDQLSYTLRTLKFEDGRSFNVNLYPMQVSSKAKIPNAVKAHISVSRAEPNELKQIDSAFFNRPWKITVDRKEGTDLTYWINDTYPNHLLKMEASDGRELSLKSLERDDYWAYE